MSRPDACIVGTGILAADQTAAQRRMRDHTEPQSARQGDELDFEQPGGQRIFYLQADERSPAVGLRQQMRMRHLPGRRIGNAEITQLPRLNEIVERLEHFFQRRPYIPIVQPIEIEIIGAQPSESLLETGNDGFTAERFAMSLDIEFGGDDKTIASDRILRDIAADNRLATRFGGSITGIEIIATEFEIARQDGIGLIFMRLSAETLVESHGAKRKRTDAQRRAAECGIIFKMHALSPSRPASRYITLHAM